MRPRGGAHRVHSATVTSLNGTKHAFGRYREAIRATSRASMAEQSFPAQCHSVVGRFVAGLARMSAVMLIKR